MLPLHLSTAQRQVLSAPETARVTASIRPKQLADGIYGPETASLSPLKIAFARYLTTAANRAGHCRAACRHAIPPGCGKLCGETRGRPTGANAPRNAQNSTQVAFYGVPRESIAARAKMDEIDNEGFRARLRASKYFANGRCEARYMKVLWIIGSADSKRSRTLWPPDERCIST
jgi:hypothetical protein